MLYYIQCFYNLINLLQAKTSGDDPDYGQLKRDLPADPGVSVTMSKDSLDDVG